MVEIKFFHISENEFENMKKADLEKKCEELESIIEKYEQELLDMATVAESKIAEAVAAKEAEMQELVDEANAAAKTAESIADEWQAKYEELKKMSEPKPRLTLSDFIKH